DGQLTQVFDARNPETREYDERNRLKKRTFASGRIIEMTFDDYDRVLTVTDSHGPDIVNEYEDAGNVSRLIKRTTTNGNPTEDRVEEFTPDERDRIVEYKDPMGRVTRTIYDIVGVGCNVQDKPREIIDPAGRRTKMFYDKRNRLTKSVDPRGGVTLFDYNLRGEKIAITDPEGTRTKFRFDGNRRMIRRERPTVRTTNGKTLTHTEVTNYFYNQNDLLTRQEIELPHYSNGTSMGHLVQDFQYDGHQRLTRRRQFKESPFGDAVELYEDSTFAYENNLDATLMATANNAVINLGFEYEATPPFGMTSYSTSAAEVGNPLNLIEGNFIVTPAVEHPIGVVAKDGDQLLSRNYDPAGRLTGVNASFAGRSLNTIIGHDGFGRKNSVVHSNGLEGTMSYDKLNRATNITWMETGENLSTAISHGPPDWQCRTSYWKYVQKSFG
ncbi:MAG: RHS repeat protein, partial [Bdellovibrio sp.]|nr:RHS repeat protein [Bdellovibrio sp.]